MLLTADAFRTEIYLLEPASSEKSNPSADRVCQWLHEGMTDVGLLADIELSNANSALGRKHLSDSPANMPENVILCYPRHFMNPCDNRLISGWRYWKATDKILLVEFGNSASPPMQPSGSLQRSSFQIKGLITSER